MLNLKSVIGASLFAVSAMAASSAFAYTPAGYAVAGPGPTNLTYAGTPIPCASSQFGILVSSTGTATIVNNPPSFPTKFGSTALCTSITPNGLTATTGWAIGPATAVPGMPGVYTAPVSGASVKVGALGVTCSQLSTDVVTITLNNNTHTASFNGTLHNGAVACSVSGSNLPTTVVAP